MSTAIPQLTLPYPIHAVCEMFPLMTGADFNALVEDIRANGLREAITLHEGQIVDGRNRALACAAAGVEPRFEPWDRRGSLVEFVISKNLRRRHLSYDQRVGLAVKLRGMLAEEASKRVGGRPGKGKPTPKSEEVSGESAAEAAKLLDVGRTAVMEVAAEQKHDPVVADKLIARKTTVAAVRKQALQRKTGAWFVPPAELDPDMVMITDDCAVVSCQAVITEPPVVDDEGQWDVTRLEQFTLRRAGAWNRCGAEAVVIFCTQEFLFPVHRWLDSALTSYEFQHLLVVVDRHAGCPVAKSGFTESWQPVLVYGRRGQKVVRTGLVRKGGAEAVFLDAHVVGAHAETPTGMGTAASLYRWLLPAVTVWGALIVDPFHRRMVLGTSSGNWTGITTASS